MDITHFGHSALLVTYGPATDGPDTSILLDPGAFSDPEVAELTGLDALVITHQHPDHAHPAHVATLLNNNPEAQVLLEAGTAEKLSAESETEQFADRFEVLLPGSVASVGPVTLTAMGGAHATIHPDIPAVGNIGVLLEADGEKSLAHTGDSLAPHQEMLGVDIVAWPLVAPWSKMQETIDFLRIVKPALALPIHDRVASAEGRAIYMKQSTEHAPEGTEVRDWPEAADGERPRVSV